MTSGPSSINRRDTHRECVPLSTAIRFGVIEQNSCSNARLVVGMCCSTMQLPAASTPISCEFRSPRSIPITCTLLQSIKLRVRFFTANLLSSLRALSTLTNLVQRLVRLRQQLGLLILSGPPAEQPAPRTRLRL